MFLENFVFFLRIFVCLCSFGTFHPCILPISSLALCQQEFHVAYVFIRMANSPRPGVWVLERSTDLGQTWDPWQFFADTPSDCNQFFEVTADEELYYDDQVLCTTEFSKVVPLEGGEVGVMLLVFSLSVSVNIHTRAKISLQMECTSSQVG